MEILKISLLHAKQPDNQIWAIQKSGQYMIKSSYHLIKKGLESNTREGLNNNWIEAL